jgi:uncharacterized membrane protein
MISSPRRPEPRALMLATATVLYPVVMVAAVHLVGSYPALVLLCALLLLRLVLPSTSSMAGDLLGMTVPVVIAVAAVGLVSADLGVRLYPVAMNLAMLYAFASTLWRPPSMIERFARLMEPDLDAAGVRYTRGVTMVWVGFFVINGSLALWTAVAGSWLAWTVYNGAIAYLLAGLLFGVEYLVRQRVRAHRTVG